MINNLNKKSDMENTIKYYTCINDIILNAHLGFGEEERSVTQEVAVSVRMMHNGKPEKMIQDELETRYCYFNLSENFRHYVEDKEFKLIERMGYELFSLAKEILGDETKICLELSKVKVPIDYVIGMSTFVIDEL